MAYVWEKTNIIQKGAFMKRKKKKTIFRDVLIENIAAKLLEWHI